MASLAVQAPGRATSLMGRRLHNAVFSLSAAQPASAVTKSSSATDSSSAAYSTSCSCFSRSVTSAQIGHGLRMGSTTASTWQHTVTMDNLNRYMHSSMLPAKLRQRRVAGILAQSKRTFFMGHEASRAARGG